MPRDVYDKDGHKTIYGPTTEWIEAFIKEHEEDKKTLIVVDKNCNIFSFIREEKERNRRK